MVNEPSGDLAVTFTEQQMLLLEKLRKEGTFGDSHGEIIARVCRESMNQNFGVGGVPIAPPPVVSEEVAERRRQQQESTGVTELGLHN